MHFLFECFLAREDLEMDGKQTAVSSGIARRLRGEKEECSTLEKSVQVRRKKKGERMIEDVRNYLTGHVGEKVRREKACR